MQRELVELAQAGDHEAFTVLARTSASRMYGIARLILRDTDRAQDAVQDALVLAWRHIRALRDPDAWDGWLHRLTIRACYKQARTSKRRDLVELHVEPDPEPATLLDISMVMADRDALERHLQRLSIDHRAVLVLHFYAGLPISELAGVLDIPVGTAKSRLNRGLASMRASMRSDGEIDLYAANGRTA
jgi:RNA polymerase sigma-70 factor (ECF subfamily)